MSAPRGSRRTTDVVLVLALVVAVTCMWLLTVDRDPYLGYSSDPDITRALWWVVLPGLGLFVAIGTWAGVRLVRRTGSAWVVTVLGGACVALCLVGPVVGLLAG